MSWNLIVLKRMNLAKSAGDVLGYWYWRSMFEDCFPSNKLVACCSNRDC